MSDIEVSTEGALRIVRFNRPDKKNAITGAMYTALAEAFESAEEDAAIRAILLLGSEGAFSAGNDLMDFLNTARDSMEDTPVWRYLRALANASLPIVAGVDGVAVGIGFTMLLHCDAVLVTERSKLSAPFVDLALVPEAASSMLLPARIGHIRASEIMMLGEVIDGETFTRLGLANKTVAPAQLEAACHDLAVRFAAKAPGAIRAAKRLMRGDPADIQARMKTESVLFTERLKSAEAREVMSAFMEKRAPDFSKLAE